MQGHNGAVAFHSVAAGSWDGPTAFVDGDSRFVSIITRGFALRQTEIAHGRGALQLFGPDDVLPLPRADDGRDAKISWQALSELRVATINVAHACANGASSTVGPQLMERFGTQLDGAGHQLAIMQLPRVEERLLALLWFIGRRWGVMTSEGVLIELHLKHDVIGQLVGARRSTVSLGLTRLAERGLLREVERGLLLSPDTFTGGEPPASVRASASFVQP